MSALRAERVGDQIKRELSKILQRGLKDQRVLPFTAVTAVDVTNDLSHATCYISVLGDALAQKNCLLGLQSASGYLRRQIAGLIQLRIVPELHFKPDNSVQEGLRMDKLIDATLAADAKVRAQAATVADKDEEREQDE